MRNGKFLAGRWTLFIGWVVVITTLSAIPGRDIAPLPFLEADKVAHAGLFFLGAFILFLALRVTFPWSRSSAFIVTIFVVAIFGAADEIHQLFTPGRSGADLGDWAADTLGAAVGATVGLFLNGQRTPTAPHQTAGRDRAA